MMSILQDAASICRFCLSNEDILHPVANILHSALTVESIERLTGVQILEAANPYCMVCTDCHCQIESFNRYRSICIDNDVRFKALFPILFDNANSEDCATTDLSIEYVYNDEEVPPSGILDHNYCIDVQEKPTVDAQGDPADIYVVCEEVTELSDNPKDGMVEQIVQYTAPDSVPQTVNKETNIAAEDSDADYLNQEEIYVTIKEDLQAHGFSTVEEQPYLEDIIEQNQAIASMTQNIENSNVSDMKQLKADKQSVEKKTNKKTLCYICGKFVYHLPDHMLAHAKGTQEFPCDRCSFVSSRKSNLKLHIENVHLKKVVRRCDKCDRNFTYVDSYYAHMRAKHNFGELLECKTCSKKFRHRSGLNGHINRKHNSNSNCTCSVCGFVAQDKIGLKDHSRVHSTERPFVCNYCPKAFKSPYARRAHQYIHEGVVFPCPVCDKSYRYKSQQIDHTRKVHGRQNKQMVENTS
ncbi:zinc finger protein 616-like [Anopheles maculipalpis]|uniref:zinc finger protein 616-like n=1 Tax=Anopheles maculipalpis TaxID=1496333 RepID=UPI002159AD0D|nr:zinc finger protein 616-like [Anopheles maculipalpis]